MAKEVRRRGNRFAVLASTRGYSVRRLKLPQQVIRLVGHVTSHNAASRITRLQGQIKTRLVIRYSCADFQILARD